MNVAYTPLVSIIMPAYMAEKYIAEAIQSVLEQTYPYWELLIVDDDSPDRMQERVAPFLGDTRIRYRKVARVGHAAGVRNIALREAKGELIAFLDADDLFVPETLASFVQHMGQHPECTAVYGFFKRISEDGSSTFIDECFLEEMPNGQHQPKADYAHTWQNIMTSRTIHQMCFMARASTFEQVGPFNEKLTVAEDFTYYVRMFLHNFQGVQFVPMYTYLYRTYSNSICHNTDRFNEVLSNLNALFHHLFEELSLPPEAMTYRSEFIARIYGYYARTRYNSQRMDQLKACIVAAWQHPHVSRSDWFDHCGPLGLRYLIPSQCRGSLIRLYRTFKKRWA